MQAIRRPGPAETPGVVDSVVTALMAIGRLMRQRVGRDQLDPATLWLLKHIAAGPLRVTELAACANLDTSTVSRHVAQLDRAGLVERTPDPADGRAHQVQLSDLGRQQLEDAFTRRRELLNRALAAWPPDDIAHLDRLLDRFVADVETSYAELEH